MDRLYLLDAYALVFRSFYAFIKNPRINSKGQNTSAILGFVNTLEEILTKEKPTHMAVVFDPQGPTFRHKAYPQYKAQREETPEGIRTAIPYIRKILEAYHITILEVPGYEADDVIGTASRLFDDGDTDIYMMTPDKDYAQLVRQHVSIYRPGTGGKEAETLDTERIKQKYGIASCMQMVDMLALMGDAADNIPGCRGVGEKTAARLLQEYGTVEQLLAHTAELKGTLGQRIEDNRNLITLSKWLATIKTDVPLPITKDDMRICPPDNSALEALYEELEFRQLLTRIRRSSGVKPKADDGYAGDLFSMMEAGAGLAAEERKLTINDTKPSYHLADTREKRQELVRTLLAATEISLDTETTSTNAIDARLVGMSFAVREGEAWYVPVTGQEVAEEMRPVCESLSIAKVGQNLKYDINVLANHGISLQGAMFDTMIAHYLVSPELHHNMDYMAETLLNYRTIHIEELIGPRGRKQKNMADIPPAEVKNYACEDADITLRLKNVLAAELKEKGCDSLFRDIEMPLVSVLARMERNGVRIDTEGLSETSQLFTREMQRIEREIHSLAGTPLNISSPRQVGELLFDTLQIAKKPKRTKRGQYVTSEEVLEGLRHKHPVVEMILAYRGLKKLLSTYIDALPLLINPRTRHIHTSFNQAVAQTGRLSSSNPNLQNIPVRGAQGKEVRKAFIPESGEEFFSADYSQIELRLMAHLSQDSNLIADFLAGNDIHAATAAKIFRRENLEEVTPDERRVAKTANFGIIYGISAFGLAERLGCSRKEAKKFIDDYFLTYPGVKLYMDKSIAMARALGYTETLFHRRLSLPDINSHNTVVRGYAERNAINAPIQGSAADIMKIATVRIDRRMQALNLRSKMILQVHDELNFSVPPEEKDVMQSLVLEEMQTACKLSVPLIAECGWGNNWLEAH